MTTKIVIISTLFGLVFGQFRIERPPLPVTGHASSYFGSFGETGNIAPSGRLSSQGFSQRGGSQGGIGFNQGGIGLNVGGGNQGGGAFGLNSGNDAGVGFDIPVYSYTLGLGSLGSGMGAGSDDYPGYGYGLGYFGGQQSYGSNFG